VDFGSAIVAAKDQGILSSGGGHKMAAGFTTNIENLTAVKSFLHNRFSKELSLLSDQQVRYFDSYVSIESVNLDLAKKLETLGPFGPSNNEPRFVLTNIYIYKAMVFGENHVSCFIRDADSKNTSGLLKANAFRGMNTELGSFLLGARQPINLVGYIKINRWKGKESPEFFIEDAILI
jgi:single-stranded-DNA-specific exonuclease